MVKSKGENFFLEYPLGSNRWSPHLLVIIILPFILFWRWVLKGEVLYWGTLLFQFWPWHQLVKTSLLAGEWPLWNPLLGNGTPLLANLQSAVFYPPNLLYLLLPVEHGLTLSVILHLALAGVFMGCYTRHLGLHPFAATLSALTYMLSGYLVGRTQFVTMINAAAWIPLVLLLCEKLVATSLLKREGGPNILWLGLALAMPLLAGHAQLWFYSLWLMGAYTIFRSWPRGHGRTSEPVREQVRAPAHLATATQAQDKAREKRWWSLVLQAAWRLGLAASLSILLSAAQLLPTAEFTLQSVRSGGAERAFALTYSFWPWRLVTLLAPDFFGHPARHNYWGYANYWEDHAYVGILPLLLALIAIWRYFRKSAQKLKSDRQPATQVADGARQSVLGGHTARSSGSLLYWQVVPFFAGLIPISLILAMGWNTPIYLWVFDYVPGFAYFQAPSRLLIWYTIAMAVLAGVGAQSFELTAANRPVWRRLLVGGVGITIAGLAGNTLVLGRGQTFLTATITFGVWFTLAVILLLTRPKQGDQPKRMRRSSLWQWSAISLVAINLWWAAWPLIPMLPPDIFNHSIASANFLKTQPNSYRFFVDDEFDYATKFHQYFRFDTFGPPEMAHWQNLRESLVPNIGIYAGLPSANNDDPLVVGHWQVFTDLLKKANPSQRTGLLSLMNVGYYLNRTGEGVGPTIHDGETVTIQRLSTALPRAYFLAKAYWARDEAEAIARLTAPDFDSRQEVVIMRSEFKIINPRGTSVGPIEPTHLKSQASDVWPVIVNEQGPGQVLLTVDAPEPGFVVLTDTYYLGWQVTLDGQPTPMYQANLAFRAVALEAGNHEIIFSYQPRSFTVGLWLSSITLLVIVISNGLRFTSVLNDQPN